MSQPTTVGHYRLHEPLGRGSYGTVYRATDTYDVRYQVAVKVLHPSLAEDQTFTDVLLQERRVLSNLSHPGIVAVRDLVRGQGVTALVLELLQGEDLAHRLERGAIDLQECASILRQVLEALAYAHSQRPPVIHRDLKPSNIFITSSRQVKLVDFGIARAVESSRASQTGRLAPGTCGYMAPETWSGQRTAAAADVYAAGLIAWELLTGRSACPEGALPAVMAWHLNSTLEDPRVYRPDTPAWLAEFVLTLASRDLKRRPSDGADALRLLNSLTGSWTAGSPLPVQVEPIPDLPPRLPTLSWRRVGQIAAVASLTMVMAGASVAAVMSLVTPGEPPTPPPGPDPIQEPLPEIAAACSDEGATSPFAEAASAWAGCRFDQALPTYTSANVEGQPAGVKTCVTERRAAAGADPAPLVQVGALVGDGRCHAAKGALAAVTGFAAPASCLSAMDECEARERRDIEAEVARSKATLSDALVDGSIIQDVQFRRVPSDPWQWDVVVRGEWSYFFSVMQSALSSEDMDGTALALQAAAALTSVTGQIGKVSQSTRWRSRRLVLEDGGTCVTTIPMSKTRDVSRRLKKAEDEGDLMEAIMWTMQQIQDC